MPESYPVSGLYCGADRLMANSRRMQRDLSLQCSSKCDGIMQWHGASRRVCMRGAMTSIKWWWYDKIRRYFQNVVTIASNGTLIAQIHQFYQAYRNAFSMRILFCNLWTRRQLEKGQLCFKTSNKSMFFVLYKQFNSVMISFIHLVIN